MKLTSYVSVTLLIFTVIIFSSCSNETMSQGTYNKIQNGMTISEVDKIMHFDETKSNSSGLQYSNGVMRYVYQQKDDPTSTLTLVYSIAEKKQEIIVKFSYGKVINKEFKGL